MILRGILTYDVCSKSRIIRAEEVEAVKLRAAECMVLIHEQGYWFQKHLCSLATRKHSSKQ